MKATKIGRTDTAIRATLGILLMVLAALAADAHPLVSLGVGFLASVILVTAMVGVCPLYTVLGIHAPPNPRPQPPFSITPKPAHLH
jgi:DUF2892 family protein